MTTNSLEDPLRHTMRRGLWITVAPTALLVRRRSAAAERGDAVKQVSA